jgi:NAD-dependent deacetylase
VKFVSKIKTNENKSRFNWSRNKCRKWIKTFRDSDGLWEGHNVQDVATPEGWSNNPALVLDFIIKDENSSEVHPNLAHQILVELEAQFDVL